MGFAGPAFAGFALFVAEVTECAATLWRGAHSVNYPLVHLRSSTIVRIPTSPALLRVTPIVPRAYAASPFSAVDDSLLTKLGLHRNAFERRADWP